MRPPAAREPTQPVAHTGEPFNANPLGGKGGEGKGHRKRASVGDPAEQERLKAARLADKQAEKAEKKEEEKHERERAKEARAAQVAETKALALSVKVKNQESLKAISIAVKFLPKLKQVHNELQNIKGER